MDTIQKVKINLGEKAPASPPVKVVKPRNGSPSDAKFLFRPKAFPHLCEYIKSLRWDEKNKTISVVLKETPKFEVYQWIVYTNKQNHDLEKSPFVDIDTNSATLTFADHDCVPVATVKFKTLSVEEHACPLTAPESSIWENEDYVHHSVVLSYKSCEHAVHADEPVFMGGMSPKQEEELKDAEWQTVESPK